MKSVPEKITPKKAQEWLAQNKDNRPRRPAVVDRYAAAMKRGEWKMNGESIKFNCDGRLIDGQHRLLAIVSSGCTIETYVVRGLPVDAFDTIDQGAVRHLADVFARNGEVNCHLLAGAIRWLGVLHDRKNWKSVGYTPDQAKSQLSEHPELRKSVSKVAGSNTKSLIPGSILATCHYLFARKDAALADIFVEGLIGGEGLKKSDPVYLLRERLIANGTATAKLPRETIAALTIKAWNATREGKPMRTLKWIEGDLPEIK